MALPTADIYAKLVTAKLFIDQHFDEPIGLETVASHAMLSSFHFHRLFTKVYKITPHQYITKKRLEKARQLLRSGSLSIAGICTDLGFASHGSFSVLFKKYNGMAPKPYQTKALQLLQKSNEQPRFVIPSCFLPPDSVEKK
ncbi:MAG: AraC family transcriptional regulator [Sediminibacterium sp.]